MENRTFSNNLRMLIESRGMTIQGFGMEVNIPTATLSRYLTGDREPKLSYVLKIANYFNVSLDWLFGISGEQFDVFPQEIREIASLYSVASPDDRRVVQAVLSKYKKG